MQKYLLLLLAIVILNPGKNNAMQLQQESRWVGGSSRAAALYNDYCLTGVGGYLQVFNVNTYEKLAELDLGDVITHITIAGNAAYISASGAGTVVIDISDPEHPDSISTIAGYTPKSVVDNNFLYIASYTDGFKIYDIQDPLNPVFTGALDVEGFVMDISVKGNYAYLMNLTKGIQVINIADKSAPQYIKDVLTTENALVSAVYGKYLLVGFTNYGEGIDIFDLTDPDTPQKAAYIDSLNYIYDMKIKDNYLFTASAWYGVFIYDLTNPLNPVEYWKRDSDYVVSVDVNNSNLVYADQENGMVIMPMNDDAQPVIPNKLELDCTSTQMLGFADYLYIPEGRSAHIVNVKPPQGLSYLKKVTMKIQRNIVYEDKKLYSSYSDYIYTYDLTDPLNPSGLDSLKMKGDTYRVAKSGNYVFACANGSYKSIACEIIDATNPADLKSVSQINYLYRFIRHYPVNDRLYALDEYGGLFRIDISNIAAPVFDKTPIDPDSVLGFWIKDNLAFVTTSEDLLKIYDIGDPDNFQLLKEYSSTNFIGEPLFYGNLAYTSTYNGMRIFDFSNPLQAREIGFLDIYPYFTTPVIIGNQLYVYKIIMENLIMQFSLADPVNPGVPGVIRQLGYNNTVAVNDQAVFVANQSGAFLALDMQQPKAQISSSISTSGSIKGIALSGDLAFLAEDNFGMRIINVADPAYPVQLGNYHPTTNGSVTDVLVHGNYAYLYGGIYGLKIIDISNPESPMEAGSLPAANAYSTGKSCLHYPYFYCTEGNAGVKIVNVANPEAPEIISTINTDGTAYDVDYKDNYLYVADGRYHLRVYDVQNPAAPVLMTSVELRNCTVERICIAGKWAFLCCSYNGVYIFDITDPANPVEAGHITFRDCEITDAFFHNGYLYFSDKYAGVFKYSSDQFTAIQQNSLPTPTVTRLYSNYPNPFNTVSCIEYELAKPGLVKLEIFNINGQKIKTLVNHRQESGFYRINWDATNDAGVPVATGLYLYRLKTGDSAHIKRMILLK
ncbi:MAG TPA: T9SS type A sorting domain-containing protein [bacterium]|nr:T9SS type A sorting domain-containing protein [bacterium]HPN43323.1 T9SS type A sorting domain-containing protein [bacterium]